MKAYITFRAQALHVSLKTVPFQRLHILNVVNWWQGITRQKIEAIYIKEQKQ
jgi:hypothetical protein